MTLADGMSASVNQVQMSSVAIGAASTLTQGSGTSVMDSLTFTDSVTPTYPGDPAAVAPTGTFDLGSGYMVVVYEPGSSPINDVKWAIYNAWSLYAPDLQWYGPGITSSVAQLDADRYTVGFVDQGQVFLDTGDLWYGVGGSRGETFGGVDVPWNSVLVRMTYSGDVDLDGKVNSNDVDIISGNYSPDGPTGAEYWSGDIYGFDGWVYSEEVDRLSAGYGNGMDGVPPGSTPEPATLALLGLGALAALARRRRHG
jgi:hypothetical protein